MSLSDEQPLPPSLIEDIASSNQLCLRRYPTFKEVCRDDFAIGYFNFLPDRTQENRLLIIDFFGSPSHHRISMASEEDDFDPPIFLGDLMRNDSDDESGADRDNRDRDETRSQEYETKSHKVGDLVRSAIIKFCWRAGRVLKLRPYTHLRSFE